MDSKQGECYNHLTSPYISVSFMYLVGNQLNHENFKVIGITYLEIIC